MPWFLAFSYLSRMFLEQLHLFSRFPIAIVFANWNQSCSRGRIVWKLKFDFNDDVDCFNYFNYNFLKLVEMVE